MLERVVRRDVVAPFDIADVTDVFDVTDVADVSDVRDVSDAGDACIPVQDRCVAAEQCNNGLDDNCNGTVDEGCLCVNGQTQACGSNVGACTKGTQTCFNGAWGMCIGGVGPAPETCNNVDDDCDGSVDEGVTQACYTGPGGTSGVGACHAGTQTCSAGVFSGACVAQVTRLARTGKSVFA